MKASCLGRWHWFENQYSESGYDVATDCPMRTVLKDGRQTAYRRLTQPLGVEALRFSRIQNADALRPVT
jgi:hypothetical protein